MQAVEAEWNEGRQDTIKDLEEAVAEEKKAQWRAEGQELLIQAKKENILLQLEAAYRERLMNTYYEVSLSIFSLFLNISDILLLVSKIKPEALPRRR